MQKLGERKTYTPRNTSLVPCSVTRSLNREETLSEMSLKTSSNNPEVNLRQHTCGLKDKVYVKSVDGQVLMPCSNAKARHLLESGKAKVVRKYPFQIQLLFVCENKVQDVVLGVDTGYENIGFSAVSGKEELLGGTMKLENKMSSRLLEKKMYRRGRRNKLWYREARFNNRVKKGWLAPSVERRINTHVELVKRICKLLPISKVNVEGANFDIQRIENPNVEGKGYQQGSLYDYENVKAFVVAREEGKCQLCGREYDDNGWHLHHIIPRGQGGTDRPKNQALLHNKCHDKLHKQKLYKKLKKEKQYKAETFMSTARLKILERISKIHPNVNISYGYETKVKRIEQGLEKIHSNDAFIIADGTEQVRSKEYILEQKKRNNRVLQLNRNRYKPSIRKQRSVIQPKDIFWVNGIKYIAKGMFNYGKYILYGDVKKKEYFKIEKVDKYFNINSWQFIPRLKAGVFLPQRG